MAPDFLAYWACLIMPNFNLLYPFAYLKQIKTRYEKEFSGLSQSQRPLCRNIRKQDKVAAIVIVMSHNLYAL